MSSRYCFPFLLFVIICTNSSHSQVSGARVEQLLFSSPTGDTLLQVRFQQTEGGRILRTYSDGDGFLIFRALAGPDSGTYLNAADDTLYRSRQIQAGDSVRLLISDALGHGLIGAVYLPSAGPAGSYTIRSDSLLAEATFKYVSNPDGRADSIYVSQAGGLTHIIKVKYSNNAGIGKSFARTYVMGFTYVDPGEVRIRFSPGSVPRKIAADLYRLNGDRVAEFSTILAAENQEYLLSFGSFSRPVPAGAYYVRFYLGSEESFRFRLTQP